MRSALSGDDGIRPRPAPLWGRDIPFRNRYFTGRVAELEELRSRLTQGGSAVIDQPPQALYGLGGVGKTEIAAEYAHRYRGGYRLIWWIRAEQADSIVNALIGLGSKMQLPGFRQEERDFSARLVVDALQSGDPYQDWLLIYDNAKDADMISEYIPRGPGHVIITSRDSHWRKALGIDGIEVAEFSPQETVDFLRKRVPALAEEPEQAAELAEELGHLPLAAEHAAAYVIETGTPLGEYLARLRHNAHELFANEVDITYPMAVATTWSVSREAISSHADTLFKLLAFFSPEPIAEELLAQPTADEIPGLPSELVKVLADVGEFRRAVRMLARFSLVRIDGVRNVVQMHRLVQAVTQGRLEREDPEAAAAFRHSAHLLLAASDPNSPDKEESDPIYERSRPHLLPSGAIESSHPKVRRLIIHQVRRLHLRGGYRESLALGQRALRIWRKQNKKGSPDAQTLELAIQVGVALRLNGNWQQAFELNSQTLNELHVLGEDDPTYLTCARSHGVDLRMLGRYAEALRNDEGLLPAYEQVFGREHLDTLALRNNIAIGLRCLGRFEEALRLDEDVLLERENQSGPQSDDTLTSRFAVARDLRRLGRYEEALDMIREVDRALDEKGAPWHVLRILVAFDLAISLRRVGQYQDAARQGEYVLRKQRAEFGEDHRHTLLLATNLINDRRLVDDLAGAEDLGRATLRKWTEVTGEDHPNTHATRANLAAVLRLRGNPSEALRLNEQALAGFRRHFDGDGHPSSLVVLHNMASDLFAMGEVRRARELGEHAYRLSRQTRGELHPSTLATGANLALDRNAVGDEPGSAALRQEILAGYQAALPDHPDARLAAQFGRIILDVEPMTN